MICDIYCISKCVFVCECVTNEDIFLKDPFTVIETKPVPIITDILRKRNLNCNKLLM